MKHYKVIQYKIKDKKVKAQIKFQYFRILFNNKIKINNQLILHLVTNNFIINNLENLQNQTFSKIQKMIKNVYIEVESVF